MGDMSGFLTGFAGAVDKYLQTNNQNQQTMKNEVFKNKFAEDSKIKEQAMQQQNELAKGKAMEQNKQDLAGKVTPDMAESLIPGSSKWVGDFQKQNGRLPTVDEAKEGMQSALLKLQGGDDHEQKRQDMLEKNFADKLTAVRGDDSIKRTELQRDAAGMAYDTIAKARAEKRPLTELEQTDLKAQLAKARFGTVTDNIMKDINEKTGKRDFNHFITYVTGNPSLIGATTEATLDNLQQFIVATGEQADQQNTSYMAPRMNPPSGLAKERVEHVMSQHRGLSFADQRKVSDTTHGSKNKGTTGDPLGLFSK